MRIFAWTIALCFICLPALCSTQPQGQQTPPQASLAALQDMFGQIRDSLWEKSDDYFHRGEYERCIAIMRLITQLDPHDVQAYDDGAWLMQNQFRDDEAESYLREGLRNNVDVYDLYFSLGYFYYTHLRFEDAIPCMEAASTFEVPFYVRNMLAHTYEHSGDPATALEVWTENEFSDPGSVIPHNHIDRILRGEPPAGVPEGMSRSRQERQKQETGR